MKPQPGSTVDTVRDFWQSHINNEYYTDAARASEAYFSEIEERRYRTHYHLPELFASMDGHGKKLLEVGCGIGVDSIQLAKRGYQVTAVDLTENALAVARQFAAQPRGHHRLPARQRRGARLPRRELRRRLLVRRAPPHARTSSGPWRRCTGCCGPAGRRT